MIKIQKEESNAIKELVKEESEKTRDKIGDVGEYLYEGQKKLGLMILKGFEDIKTISNNNNNSQLIQTCRRLYLNQPSDFDSDNRNKFILDRFRNISPEEILTSEKI